VTTVVKDVEKQNYTQKEIQTRDSASERHILLEWTGRARPLLGAQLLSDASQFHETKS
jgi:hypothetical protein